jgi:hypothetical protein
MAGKPKICISRYLGGLGRGGLIVVFKRVFGGLLLFGFWVGQCYYDVKRQNDCKSDLSCKLLR